MDADRPRAEPPEGPEEASEEDGAPAIPRWVIARFLVFLAVVGVGFVLFRYTPIGERINELLDRERLAALRESLQERWWTAPLLVLVYVVIAPLGAPVSPLMLAGGAIFGTLVGSALNFLGTFLGAAASYFLARALGRDFVVHLTGDRFRRVEKLIARRGFWTLVRTRFLPIPFPVVNYGAALAGVPAGLFLVTTAIGLLPANIVFTYFAAALVDAVAGDRAAIFLRVGLAIAGLFALSFLPTAIIARQRRRRFHDHRERRRRLGR